MNLLMQHVAAGLRMIATPDPIAETEDELRRLDEEITDLMDDCGGDPGSVRWPRYAEELLYTLYVRRDRLAHRLAWLSHEPCACGACEKGAGA